MSGLDETSATYGPRIYNQEVLPDVLGALQTALGKRILSKTNVLRTLQESGIARVYDLHEQDLAALTSIALDPFSADLEALRGHLWPIDEPRIGKTSAGVVELDYIEPFTSPDPWLNRTDVLFTDASDRQYQPDADIPVPEKLFEKTGTGTASESISSGGTSRIAQRIVLTEQEYTQGVRFHIDHVSGTPTVTIRVLRESASATEPDPSNVLLADAASLLPGDGVDFNYGFNPGAYTVEDGEAIWFEIEATAGTFTVDGSNTGDPGDVKVWNGSNYANSATINALNFTLYAGGVVPVTALFLGSLGNIDADGVIDAVLATTAAQTDWDANVGDGRFGNANAFTGGADAETAAQARNRVRYTKASRYGGSPPGLERAIEDVSGVIDAKVVSNTGSTATADETPYDGSADTGTASSTIDGTTPFIAHRFTPTFRSFTQRIALTLASDTSFEGTVRLESDASGDPGGLLATGTINDSYVPGGTSRVVVVLDKGAYIEPGTFYNVTVQRTAGSATFDGETASGDGNVQNSTDGVTWATDSAVDNLNVELIGGVPDKSGMAVVRGGASAAIAEAIHLNRAIPSELAGDTSGTFTRNGVSITEYFRRPTAVPVVVDVDVETTAAYPGGDDALKDTILRYFGGKDSDGVTHPGPGIGEPAVGTEAAGRLQDDDELPGIHRTTLFRMGRKSGFATPGALTASESVFVEGGYDLTASDLEYLTIEDPANDIRVTRTPI